MIGNALPAIATCPSYAHTVRMRPIIRCFWTCFRDMSMARTRVENMSKKYACADVFCHESICTLRQMKKTRPDILPEFKDKMELLQNENPIIGKVNELAASLFLNTKRTFGIPQVQPLEKAGAWCDDCFQRVENCAVGGCGSCFKRKGQSS